MKVTLTKQDVHEGRIWDPDLNPVGWALRRAGIFHYGVVDSVLMLPDDRDHAVSVSLPKSVANWISRARQRTTVKPMTFEIPVRLKKRRRALRTAR